MHAHEAGGVNAGALVVAVPFLVLGVVLFFQKTTAPMVSVVLVGIGVIVAVGSFTFLAGESDDEGDVGAAEPPPTYQAAIDALCEARDAEAGEASDLFFDRAHGPLHVLADDVAAEDREVTARLLEAKQEVEASLDAGSDVLRGDFQRLIETTLAALSVADVEVEACA